MSKLSPLSHLARRVARHEQKGAGSNCIFLNNLTSEPLPCLQRDLVTFLRHSGRDWYKLCNPQPQSLAPLTCISEEALTKMAIKIVLADAHTLLRQGLRTLLESYADFSIVGEACNGDETRRLTEQLQPDVLVMDVGIPELNAVEFTRQLRSERQQISVIGLYEASDKINVTKMFRAGAEGHLYKRHITIHDLANAIREVHLGHVYVDSEMMSLYRLDDGSHLSSENANELDSSEREVLQYLASGSSIRDIAERGRVSAKTIARRRDKIMQKLLIFSVAGLTKFAIRNGLTSLE